jgi:type IV pilus assembly protein PilN
MKITLNLATRPYSDLGPALKQLRIGMLVLVVVMIGLGLGLLHFHQSAQKMRAQEDAAEQSASRVRHEQAGYQAYMQKTENAQVLTQAQFLNGLFDEKSFSWTAAMEDLERVLPAGVQVTAIEPARGKDGRLTLRLRISGDRERSVSMMRNMEHSVRFVSPRITGENSENNSQSDLQPVKDTGKVSFDVLAEYNPATLEERRAEIAHQKRARTSTPAKPKPALAPGRPQYVPPNPQPAVPSRTPQPFVRIGPGMRPNGVPQHDMNRNRPVNSTVPNANGGPQ